MQTAETHAAAGPHNNLHRLLFLSVGSIGVVYGDIGTSPLYAFRQALKPVAGDGLNADEIVGIISLMLWSLTIIVTMKYVALLLRADNDGEGGTLSLLALLQKRMQGGRTGALVLFGMIGAGLFVGDAMITPALSVMSAVEGLNLVTPELDRYVLPLSVLILVTLFAVQSRGTSAVSKGFGPITLIWFAVLASAGLSHIVRDPHILRALNPFHAVHFLLQQGTTGFAVLGAVFLTVTGAEALYADLGHFGRKPIQLAWFCVVFPSLGLNYLGQGALVLGNPEAARDPFFLMFPHWALVPVILLATAATIIASQAVITGAFSLTRQAMHLGFLPRLDVIHTSRTDTGQIYLPAVNTALLFGVMVLVLIFQTSDSLSTAYGISVTGAMIVTTFMFFDFLRHVWKWSVPTTLALTGPLALIELVFLGANLSKVHEGGYVPISIAACAIIAMWTWRRGSDIISDKMRRDYVPLRSFVDSLERSTHGPHRVAGTGIFLTSDPETTPPALLHNIKHNHVIHERNIILTIVTEKVPSIPYSQRARMERVSPQFLILTLHYGFMDEPNISQALAHLRKEGLKFDIMSTTFYVGRRKLVSAPNSAMPAWQDKLFIALASASTDPSDYYRLPVNRVVELGSHVTI